MISIIRQSAPTGFSVLRRSDLPVCVCWDSGVTQPESQAILEGITEMSILMPHRIFRSYGSESFGSGYYSSPDWYVHHARHRSGPQINADDILLSLHSEPWQRQTPHVDILVTSRDLYTDSCNFVFGLASPTWHVSVESVFRLRGLTPNQQNAAIRQLIRHELGHLCGLVPEGRTNSKYLLGTHCTNPSCTMQQGMNVQEWLAIASQTERTGQLFCRQCLQDLR